MLDINCGDGRAGRGVDSIGQACFDARWASAPCFKTADPSAVVPLYLSSLASPPPVPTRTHAEVTSSSGGGGGSAKGGSVTSSSRQAAQQAGGAAGAAAAVATVAAAAPPEPQILILHQQLPGHYDGSSRRVLSNMSKCRLWALVCSAFLKAKGRIAPKPIGHRTLLEVWVWETTILHFLIVRHLSVSNQHLIKSLCPPLIQLRTYSP